MVQVWLHQCSLRYRVDALDSTSTAMLIAYLVQSNVINKSMNPIQGFLVFVESLGKWRSRGTIFQFASLLKSEAEKEQWMNTFSCCLLQPVMSVLNNEKNNNRPIHLVYNMLWRVSSSGWNDVQREATRASMLLKQALSRESIGNARTASLGGMVGLDAFQCIFLNKRTLCQQYDQLFHVSLKFRNGENPYYQLLSNQCCNETLIARIAKYLRVALRYALTDRISTLAVIPRWEECTAHW